MNIVMLYQPKHAKACHSYAIGDLYHSTEVLEPSHVGILRVQLVYLLVDYVILVVSIRKFSL